MSELPVYKINHNNNPIIENLINYIMDFEYEKILDVRYGEEKDGHFKGIAYYYFPDHLNKMIINTIIPFEYREYYLSKLMIINRKYIPPHIDSDILVSINLYIKTSGNSITTFYNENSKNKLNKIKIKNQTDGYILDNNDLDKIHSIIAKKNDLWILNVKKLHSVECEIDDEERIAIVINSKILSYEETLKIFKP